MDSDILNLISFLALLIMINFSMKNKKKDGITWTGIILTSLTGAGFISKTISGESFLAGILLLALGIYLILKKPKTKSKQKTLTKNEKEK